MTRYDEFNAAIAKLDWTYDGSEEVWRDRDGQLIDPENVLAALRRSSFQFRLGGLFRLTTVLASAAAIFAWTRPYFAVGVDPPLAALPVLAIALGALTFALLYPRRY